MYEIRDDNGDVIEIAKCVICNHWGTLITCDEVSLITNEKFSYLTIGAKDLIYETGDCHSMQDFILKYPKQER